MMSQTQPKRAKPSASATSASTSSLRSQRANDRKVKLSNEASASTSGKTDVDVVDLVSPPPSPANLGVNTKRCLRSGIPLPSLPVTPRRPPRATSSTKYQYQFGQSNSAKSTAKIHQIDGATALKKNINTTKTSASGSDAKNHNQIDVAPPSAMNTIFENQPTTNQLNGNGTTQLSATSSKFAKTLQNVPSFSSSTQPSINLNLSRNRKCRVSIQQIQLITNPMAQQVMDEGMDTMLVQPSTSSSCSAIVDQFTYYDQNATEIDNKSVGTLQESERFEIMLTFEICNCSWCGENLGVGDGIVLQDCCHSFCRNCLVDAINSSKFTEIKCPVSEQCGGRVLDSEIKALIPPEEYEVHLKKSLQQVVDMLPNMFKCKTVGCTGWCEFGEDSKVFLCPICNKRNCIACKSIHEGIECVEYQKLIAEAMKGGKTAEEAQIFVKSHSTDGFEQLVGTVSNWMSASTINNRKSQQYSQVLQRMADQDLWVSCREFECSICFDNVPIGDGVIFECLHSFCRVCSIAVVEHATDPEVKCPYQDGNYSCVYILQPREIRALVSPELYEVHLLRSVKLAENAMANTFHCKTPDCAGWCEYEPGTECFKCWICSKTNCLKCEVIHEKLSCQDYKNRLVQNTNDVKSAEAVEEMITKGECMRCPKCKVPCQKIAGCDWLQCSVCKTEICWATKGPRWGPQGKGDVTGGCKCRINGKLCHPKCGNCH